MARRMAGKACCITISLFAFLAITGLYGEDFVRPTRIRVEVLNEDEIDQPAVGEFIGDAVELELTLNGFDPVAAGDNTDFILRSLYSISGNQVSVASRLIPLAGNREKDAIGNSEWSGPLSLSSDEELQRSIRRDIVPLIPASMTATKRETEKAADAGESWAVIALGIDDSGKRDSDREAAEVLADSAASSRWRLAVNGAGYFPVSETATFARIGFGGSATLGYSFRLGTLILGVGIETGAMFFNAQAASSANLLFIPAGAVVRLGAPLSGAFQPWVRIGGGMMWFLFMPDTGSTENKFVPYAEAAVGTDIFFGSSVGLNVETAFRVIFEGSVILYHFAPSLGIVFRF